MINNDSIVTAYDEHLTLVEWLQKVEKALDNAVLTNLGIAKLSDQGNIATYRVTATFADNTTIVSDTFTLPSTNIVTAFNDLTALVNGFNDRITDNTNDVASIIDIIDIGNDKIKASTLQNSINGSDEVIVDIDATNDKLEIHLSAELQAKLARVLLKPSSAPTTRKVVTIDTNGAQDNVNGTELNTALNNIVDNNYNQIFEKLSNPDRVKVNYPIEDTALTFNFIVNGATDTSKLYASCTYCDHKLHIVISGTFTCEAGADVSMNTTDMLEYIANKIHDLDGNVGPTSWGTIRYIIGYKSWATSNMGTFRLQWGANTLNLFMSLGSFSEAGNYSISAECTLEI